MIAVTQTQFAHDMGVNKSTVTRWKAAGRLVMAPNGKVMVQESIASLEATQGHRSDVSQRHAQYRGHTLPTQQKTQHSATEQDETADMQATASEIGEDRAYYKAVALDSKNKQDKLEDALSNGNRLHKDEYLQSISQQASDLKNGIERLIDNLTPQLTALPESKRLEKIQTAINSLIQQNA